MFAIDNRAFLASAEAMADAFDLAIERAMDQAAAVGLMSLRRTTRFADRTGDLRGSFALAGARGSREEPSRTLEVDPKVPGRARLKSGRWAKRGSKSSGATPPNAYARFLANGTRWIAARPFDTDAQSVIEDALPGILETAIAQVNG